MSEHVAEIVWKRETESFAYDHYNRGHEWSFDAGVTVPGSAAPAYKGDADRVDPEEAFVASLSSCHMLTFLAIAAKKKLVVDAYADRAVGHMDKNAEGKIAVTSVDLHPHVTFAPGVEVDAATLKKMHHDAHEHCFIANSVKTLIIVHSK
ncbi:MAG: OsmC family protein [Parvularculaceae bacterium]|nr:OsmC family protein [Parvularculaceae bacterium]